MVPESSIENLRKVGVEFDGPNVILYHVTTAENLANILKVGEMRPASQVEVDVRSTVWTNPGERGNDDRIHLARMNQVDGIAGHMRFRLENGGGLYVVRVRIPVDSTNLVPDQDTKAASWTDSLLHSFGTCAYQGILPIDPSAVVGRFSSQPGEEEHMQIYSDAEKLQQAIDRIENAERVLLNNVGVALDEIPLVG